MLNVIHEPRDKRVYQKIAVSLAKRGHEILTIAPAPAPGADLPLPPQGGADANGIRIITIPPAPSKRARLLSMVRLFRHGLREKPDVWFAPESESWVTALALKALRGGRVVMDMHEHIPTEFAKFFPAPLRPFMVWLTIRFMRLFARQTDLIILTRESFEAPWTGLSTPRVTIINTNHLVPPCAEVPERVRSLFGDRPTLIHQGVFGDIRGSWKLLEAMKAVACEMPEARCVVLGSYLYGDAGEYRRAVTAAGLDGNLLFIPTVPYDEVPAYVSAARAGLILFQPGLLNHTLAMPHKLFDYMREGRPVIAPDFALEVSRIVREGDCGILVDVTKPEAIAEAMLRLLRNPAEAERLGGNGRRLVEAKYNWQQEERVLLGAFEALEAR